MKIRVYYEDTDVGGVVYHSNYLNFCERARSELFFERLPEIFDAHMGHFLLVKAECEFKKSAKIGDILEIKSTLLELKKASVRLKQEIFKNETLIFRAIFTLAFVKSGKASAMSEKISTAFKELFTKDES